MRPADREERLLRHVRDGWTRVRASPSQRETAQRWLRDHPGPWAPVDRLWQEALAGRGSLAEWLESGADPRAWSGAIALHSVLSSHPFASLSAWSIPDKSTRS